MWPVLTASSTLHTRCPDLPRAASLGPPGRSKSWGHECRRAGICTSGIGMGSQRRTGTCTQRRKRHKSQSLSEPKAEGLRLLGLAKYFLIVRETTFQHSGRADPIQICPFLLQVLRVPRICGLLPLTQVGENLGPQWPNPPPSISQCPLLLNWGTMKSGVEGFIRRAHTFNARKEIEFEFQLTAGSHC